ncbi:hypothetical protein FHS92_000898 [Sphingobium subterraneum]|uniref:Uncharacterized protein n=1 Tax=Sphingobium subterraneum TaxID=627688 RepID=A0A841J4M0_9SPHN|nr:hypothetical protein [Sphingobium subterraneum]
MFSRSSLWPGTVASTGQGHRFTGVRGQLRSGAYGGAGV